MDDKPQADKPVSVEFPVQVTVNGVRVTVTLMLKSGTTVSAESVAVTVPASDAPLDRSVD